MDRRESIGRKMRDHYESVWTQDDPWNFDNSRLDDERYLRQLALVRDRHYERVLDIGCGSGQFATRISDIATRVVALDIAPAAIARARLRCADKHNVDCRAVNIMDYDARAEGPWELIVMSESIYCLGWLYPLFDIGWLVSELLAAMSDNGRFLLVNTLGKETDYLLLPWLIATYKDLFLNIGFELEVEELFSGRKNDVKFDVLMSLFRKSAKA
jgi:SAM-dependent methyltransferase